MGAILTENLHTLISGPLGEGLIWQISQEGVMHAQFYNHFLSYLSANGKVHWHFLSCLAAITCWSPLFYRSPAMYSYWLPMLDKQICPVMELYKQDLLLTVQKSHFLKHVLISKAYLNSIWDILLDSVFLASLLSSFNFEIQRNKSCFIYWLSPCITSFCINFTKFKVS